MTSLINIPYIFFIHSEIFVKIFHLSFAIFFIILPLPQICLFLFKVTSSFSFFLIAFISLQLYLKHCDHYMKLYLILSFFSFIILNTCFYSVNCCKHCFNFLGAVRIKSLQIAFQLYQFLSLS